MSNRNRDYKAEYAKRKAREAKAGKKRNFKKEYARRKRRERAHHKEDPFDFNFGNRREFRRQLKELGFVDPKKRLKATKRALRKKAAKAFDIKQREVRDFLGPRVFKEHPTQVAERRAELPEPVKDVGVNFADEAEFIAEMMKVGFSEREAYTLWFSP